ncbi:hypothetical protein BDN72DRAFT_777467 [Pluteus cervinus]|uniref:Uncharacterized protein n=1 Tax=Pluteus cervinus TaxID=181527 RepID=A0ACD3A9P9_9AGAR|nr:hypothetical protein BDN72DRAFT_777467 [Pluteus cervinus]
MRNFEPLLPAVEEIIFSHEYCEVAGRLCGHCHIGEALYRCLDCFHAEAMCQTCITARHTQIPFHRIDRWTGTFFKRDSLSSLGMTLHLGHHGAPCPHKSKARTMTIGHINGFHSIPVIFCSCFPLLDDLSQLLGAKLFPPTVSHPASAFTFTLLDQMHAFSLSAKISTYDHHDILQRLTNGAFPQEAPDRYHEVYRVLRLWRLLASKRRSGQTHGIDQVIRSRRPGSLSVRCPACPEVGFNVDKATIDAASEEESHKYMLYLSIDGNYALKLLRKRSDAKDRPLNEGNGYFVPDEPYKLYLQHAGTSSDQSTCAHLRAVRQQNVSKFKNTVYSGVVSVQCARHCMYTSQGTVNLEKGEAFCRLDYALVYALCEAFNLPWIKLSSDIWCQYYVNLVERIRQCFPQMVPLFERLQGAVPKMHIKGHKQDCQFRHAFNYHPHSGETCGEGIETTWAEQNQAAASTKYQNAGHRQESLDDFFGFGNWRKSQGIVDYVTRRYTTCKADLDKREKSFETLTKKQDPKTIAAWEAMDTTPKQVNGVWTSVYIASYPGEKEAREPRHHHDGDGDDCDFDDSDFDAATSDTKFVYRGIELEDEQQRIQKLAKSHEPTDTTLVSARAKHFWAVVKWLADLEKRFPSLQDYVADADSFSFSEEIPLYLPSHWDDQTRPAELKPLAEIEFALRKGQCYDSLEDLRVAIQVHNVNIQDKRADTRGQRANTRAQNYLDTLTADKTAAADRYRRYRAALLRLGFSETDSSLQPLLSSQLWGKNMGAPAELGDTRTHEPWYWIIGRPPDLNDEQRAIWTLEDDRVRWFRARAALDRCREEKEILEAEIIRIHRSFQKMSAVWLELSKMCTTPGMRSYAYKQADMYERFRDEALEAIRTTFKIEE